MYKYKNKFEGSITLSSNVGYDGENISLLPDEEISMDDMQVDAYSQCLSGFLGCDFLILVPAKKVAKKAPESNPPSDVEGAASVANLAPKEPSKKNKATVEEAKAKLVELQEKYKVGSTEEKKKIKEEVAKIKDSIKALK